MTRYSGKEIRKNYNAHVIHLICKLIPSSVDIDFLSNDFHRSSEALEGEMTNNRTTKGIYRVRIYLTDFLVLQSIKIIALMAWILN